MIKSENWNFRTELRQKRRKKSYCTNNKRWFYIKRGNGESVYSEEVQKKLDLLGSKTTTVYNIKKKLREERTWAMKYKFRVATKKEAESIEMSSKICEIYDFMTYINVQNEKHALAFGQIKRLFGEPLYISENLEQQYEYNILCEDENQKKYIFNVYSGSTGPSIGGDCRDKDILDAAKALAEFIRSAEAEDYEYEGYYMDGPCIVKMGVKDESAYWDEKELKLSDEEFSKLYNRLYGLE